MTLTQGTIVEIFIEDGFVTAKVDIGGKFKRVPLTLLMDARVGDRVLIGSGVAIARVSESEQELVSA